jgi:hypothetical protein
MGQGEAAEQQADEVTGEAVASSAGAADAEIEPGRGPDKPRGNGVVVVDFGDLGPEAA